MSVHLVGGGRARDAAVWRPFLEEATAHAGGAVPSVVLVAVGARSTAHARDIARSVALAGPFERRIVAVGEGAELGDDLLDGADGLLVAGGLTPAYLAVLLPLARRVRALVADGVPYAGFSAGAAIAAERAVVGGWRAQGVPVLDPDAAEDLDEVTVTGGLGLVPFGVDVHAAQWGTISRLVTAVAAGDPGSGVAIDEGTALVVGGDERRVVGRGNAWFVEAAGGGRVTVQRRPAG